MNIDKLKIFGERHTATNAVSIMMWQSFKLSQQGYGYLGWKHRRAPKETEWRKYPVNETLFLITVRHPYTWLKAMHREPYAPHQPNLKDLSFVDFLRHPFEDYENVICNWNEKYLEYLRFFEEVPNSLIVRIEDFSKDQSMLFDRVNGVFGNGEFEPFNKYFNGMTGAQNPDKAKISKEVNAMPEFNKNELEIIHEYLNQELLTKFNYSLFL